MTTITGIHIHIGIGIVHTITHIIMDIHIIRTIIHTITVIIQDLRIITITTMHTTDHRRTDMRRIEPMDLVQRLRQEQMVRTMHKGEALMVQNHKVVWLEVLQILREQHRADQQARLRAHHRSRIQTNRLHV